MPTTAMPHVDVVTLAENPITTDNGFSNAGTQRVTIASNSTGQVAIAGTATVAGTVTANIGTSGSLALDATLTGGTQKAIIRGGQKGTTNTNADITHTPEGANNEA